jgi:membrane-associated phospholipid phosphatase
MSTPVVPSFEYGANRSQGVALGGKVARWILWGVAIGLLHLAFRMDAWGVELVRQNAHGWRKWLAGRVSDWGDWYGVLFLWGGAWGFGRLRRNEGIQRMILLMGLCACLTGVTSNLVRGLTGRARPFTQAAPNWFGPRAGMRFSKSAHEFQSFPSAHTAVVAGFLAPLALVSMRSRRFRTVLWGCSTAGGGVGLMAWARVWDGKHYISDVLASCLLAMAMGMFLLRRMKPKGGEVMGGS